MTHRHHLLKDKPVHELSSRRQVRSVALVRRGLYALPALALASIGFPAGASAAFPGKNGLIAFDRFASDSVTGASHAEIFTMRQDGSHVRDLTLLPGGRKDIQNQSPSFSADGKQLVFASNRRSAPGSVFGSELFVMDANGKHVRSIAGKGQNKAPSFSPNGKQIVFLSDRNNQLARSDVFVMDADGKHVRQLTPNSLDQSARPSFSPNGKTIVFSSLSTSGGFHQNIYVIDANGKHLHKLVGAGEGADPSFSPDGKQIAYSKIIGSGSDIAVIDASGSHVRKLTKDAKSGEPAFSPNGKQIVFQSTRTGNPELFVMDADGKHVHQRTKNPATDESPNWGPK